MKITILTPEKQVFSGTACGIQLPGNTGSFELLDKHAPILASLKKGNLKVIKANGGNDDINYHITGGFIECNDNNVSVMVEGIIM